MKKSFMNNIKNFVDSNVRQRIDRAANNNNDFFGDDLLVLERQFEALRHLFIEAEKRISSMLQTLNSSPLGAYTQNVQASLNNLSTNLTQSSNNNNSNAISSNSPSGHTNAKTNSQTNNDGRSSSDSGRFRSSTVSLATDQNVTLTSHQTLDSINSGLNSHYSNETDEEIKRHRKLPIIGFLKFLIKSSKKSTPNSLISTTLTHCSQLQAQLTKLYLSHEQTVECQCLKPIQQIIENDVPNIIKLRKLFIKSYNDLDSVKAKYNGASQKQQQTQTSHFTSTSYTITQASVQQASVNKLDQLKKELDESVTRFEQARDAYATELYAFVCREIELANLFVKFYQHQAEYQQQVGNIIQKSLPSLSNKLINSPKKVVFGTPLEEHLRCTGRSVSLVIELCVHLLHSRALNEEGLFRIPGSSMKIKKLKNAINAWFVTHAQEVTNSDCGQLTLNNNSSLFVVHDLFKDIVGQRGVHIATVTATAGTICIAPTNNQTTSDHQLQAPNFNQQVQNNSSHNQQPPSLVNQSDDHDGIFDVHTIAGLLKLYLRELPEPLFTYSLYQQCIDATVKALNNEQPALVEQVIRQLPRANYENLRLLIRFLHLLTSHKELNKMTATNLAITMAPSLIWAPPLDQQHSQQNDQTGGDQSHAEDMQTLNVQMSNVGISTSLHALVIENLINQAEQVFPGPIDFVISDLNEVPTSQIRDKSQHQPLSSAPMKHDRCLESSSPTGLSTASSSSFSSTSNGSLRGSSMGKKHSRKGGSMEGLLGQLSNKMTTGIGAVKSSAATYSSTRPMSIDLTNQAAAGPPPPIPPAPTVRSHLKQSNDSNPSSQHDRPSSTKPPAPPIPPAAAIKRQQASKTLTNQSKDDREVGPCSQRGTGLTSTSNSGHQLNNSAKRPTVPPPNRPPFNQVEGSKSIEQNKSSPSNFPSGNFRPDFEEISPIDVEDVDISVPSISPVISLDDSISGDDSSFENDCRSLEHSWTDCDVGKLSDMDISSKTSPTSTPMTYDGPTSCSNTLKARTGSHSSNPKPEIQQADWLQAKQVTEGEEAASGDQTDKTPGKEPSAILSPPVKPPRAVSPKVTQSTPL